LPDARVRTPKPVAERRDVRGAPLSPTDGFVLSRVDGIATEKDIVATTGLPEDQIVASLAKLEALQLITFTGVDGTRPGTPASSGTVAAAEPHVTSSTQIKAASPRAEPPLTPEEEALLDENVDLDVDMRRRVLVMHRGVQQLDHYAILGVERTVDRKALKRAYFDLAAKFHPDKYFRKSLGTFKVRMEAIFARVTLAHDTLTNREARAEYDAYLDEQRRSRGIEDLLADALAEVSRAKEDIERQAASEAPPAVVPAPSPSSPSLRDVSTTTSTSSGSRDVDPAVRREALARRLLAGRAPPAPSPSSPGSPGRTTSSPSMPSVQDAMDALRRRYEDRKAQAQTAQARKYVTNAEASLKAGDVVAAANAFKVALSLAPNEPGLVERAKEAQTKADAILAETYSKQASYEEKNDQWVDAARSWARVCRARPDDALAHDKAAHAIVKGGGDLHEASRLAQKACSLEPQNAGYRTTLANVYLAAGLTRNARRELETAAQLAPHDDTIQALLKRVGKSA
jgi:curved DNA-binding protein CbpA